MSRYPIPARHSRYEVIVGWENPLETFFCEVFDRATAEDADTACILWDGTALRAIVTVEALQVSLHPYATLSPEVLEHLRHDSAHAAPRSPLPEHMFRLLNPKERR
jgi:hypothetical protein